MNTSVPHAVMGTHAESCLLFLVVHPLALQTCPPHAAHPLAVLAEADLLSRVLRKGELSRV